MFQKDDYVIYGNSGICRVEDVGVPENYPIVRAGRLYYTLVQVFGSGTIDRKSTRLNSSHRG